MQESGCLLFPSLIILHFPLILSKHFTSFCYSFFLFFTFLAVSFSLFQGSLPTGASAFPLVTAHPVISHCDSTLLSLPCFKEPLPLGGVNRNLNQCFSTAGLLLHVIPQQHQWRRAGGGVEKRKRRRRALKYTSHMKVTSLQPGEITGPDGKVTAGRRHQASC